MGAERWKGSRNEDWTRSRIEFRIHTLMFFQKMENSNEDQGQMSTSSTLTDSSELSVPVRNLYKVKSHLWSKMGNYYNISLKDKSSFTLKILWTFHSFHFQKSQYYCCVCMGYMYVHVNGCCQRAAHKDCLLPSDFSLTTCNWWV